ncbi:hypothetical protein [Pseudonocardia yunnanensis]|uniref:LacI family DNA-binding transcriptional regulator n=1 Tax=Pseudonocardia yunnanensis TaxID=58107 RepID=A0ABW4ES41_9PSEU
MPDSSDAMARRASGTAISQATISRTADASGSGTPSTACARVLTSTRAAIG